MFVIHYSIHGFTYVCGLPECHWPNEKTVNTVVTMLHHCIESEIPSKHSSRPLKRFLFYADNCAGQNKNGFLLVYLCWRTLLGLNETIFLRILVAGHTKNVDDVSFGHVKRKLKTSDTRTTAEMMIIVADSSANLHCMAAANILWRHWKDYLQPFIKMPCNFRFTKYHVFCFDSIHRADCTRKYLRSQKWRLRLIFQSGVSVSSVRVQGHAVFSDLQHRAPFLQLKENKFTQKVPRHGYLMHKIIDRYYAGDKQIKEDFVSDGTGHKWGKPFLF